MYEQIICKDIVEANWIEFLQFIKARRDNERKQKAELKEKYPDVNVDGATLLQTSNSIEGYYYGLDTNSFWQWYLDHKV